MKPHLRRSAALFAVLVALSGCETLGLKAPEVGSPSGEDLIKKAAGLNTAMKAADGLTAPQVAELGYSTVSDSCDLYFSALIKASNRVQLTKADLTSFGTAAAVISTLSGATPRVIGSTAALFGLASSVTSNFEQYAFATPYPTQTNTLITKAMAAYEEAAPPSGMVTIQQAVASVAGYARLCSFTGISVLAQQAIAAGVPINTAGTASIFSASDRTQYLNNVNLLLAVPGKTLVDSDYVTLAAMSDSTVGSAQFAALQNTLSDNVDKSKTSKTISVGPPVVLGPSDILKLQAATYLNLLGIVNSAFAKQVVATKAAQASSAAASIFSASDRTQYLNNVDLLVAISGKSLVDSDYVALAVMSDSTIDAAQFTALQNALSSNVDKSKTTKAVSAGPPVVLGPSDLLKQQVATFLNLLATTNPTFSKQVAATKATKTPPALAPAVAPGFASGAAPLALPPASTSLPHIQIKNGV